LCIRNSAKRQIILLPDAPGMGGGLNLQGGPRLKELTNKQVLKTGNTSPEAILFIAARADHVFKLLFYVRIFLANIIWDRKSRKL
jgi:hypothetical protein